MAEMNPDRLREVADKVRQVLEEAGIDVVKLTVKVLVSREYYESIKENFPVRHPIDMIVGEGEEDWSIDLLYSSIQSRESSSKQD